MRLFRITIIASVLLAQGCALTTDPQFVGLRMNPASGEITNDVIAWATMHPAYDPPDQRISVKVTNRSDKPIPLYDYPDSFTIHTNGGRKYNLQRGNYGPSYLNPGHSYIFWFYDVGLEPWQVEKIICKLGFDDEICILFYPIPDPFTESDSSAPEHTASFTEAFEASAPNPDEVSQPSPFKLNIGEIARKSPQEVAKVLGNPTSEEIIQYKGVALPKKLYRYGGVDIRIVFVEDVADWITIYGKGQIPYGQAALASFGLSTLPPTFSDPNTIMRWNDKFGLKAIRLLPGSNETVSYAYILVNSSPLD